MRFGIYKTKWFCRLDGVEYKPKEETERDGFCCPACKQYLHRALKKRNAKALLLKERQPKRPGRGRNKHKRRTKKK